MRDSNLFKGADVTVSALFVCGMHLHFWRKYGMISEIQTERKSWNLSKLDKHLYPSVHCGIVRAALLLLEQTSHPAAGRFSAGDAEAMIGEAAAPDQIGDRQQGRGLHYYCAVKPDGTQLNCHPVLGGYCNGRGAAAPSPLTMLDSEYRAALALHRAGKYYPAMKSLSRALHFLADICCPPHCCGLTYFSRYGTAHRRYEGRAAEIFWMPDGMQLSEFSAAAEWAKRAAESEAVPYELYTGLLHGGVPVAGSEWKPGRLTEICNALALSGAGHLDAVLGDDEVTRDQSIRERLICSIVNCTALLAAFDRDLNDMTLPVWEERHPYWLKSFGTAFVVSKDPLYLQFEDDGTVTLATLEGAYLAVGKLGRVLVTDQIAGLESHFRFGREPLLTLYPNGDQDHLVAQLRGQLHSIRRITHLQGALFQSQTSFVLLNQKPDKKKVKFMF